jgi:peptidoglycan hydrolase-like protein with peptidoglycan-binding domain
LRGMRSRALIEAATAAVLVIISGIGIPIAAQKPAAGPAQQAGAKGPDILAVQVMLDRARFSPGEIDGKGGPNTKRAIEAFERAKSTTVAEAVAAMTDEATVSYTITADDEAGPFAEIPDDMMEKAKLKRLSYASLAEALAERFHASPALLKQLNPSARYVAGEQIKVPNVMAAPEPTSGAGVSITVSKQTSALTLTDATGAVIYHAPVTTGSQHDPLPIGDWKVTGIARNPVFNYNPDLFWDADPAHAKAKLPAGPNGPVGVVWIAGSTSTSRTTAFTARPSRKRWATPPLTVVCASPIGTRSRWQP